MLFHSSRIDEALAYVCELHRDHARKQTRIPYLSHLMAVCSIVMEYADPLADDYEDMAIAALLHDAIEDRPHQGRTRQEILEKFGPRVAEIVDGCSDSDGEESKAPWQARKDAYIAHIPSKAANVLLVSAADKLHNSRAILRDLRAHGEALWPRFNGGRDGSLWYYQALADACLKAPSLPRPLAEELKRTVDAITHLATESARV